MTNPPDHYYPYFLYFILFLLFVHSKNLAVQQGPHHLI